jgi:hypothetical protein
MGTAERNLSAGVCRYQVGLQVSLLPLSREMELDLEISLVIKSLQATSPSLVFPKSVTVYPLSGR